MQHSHGYGHLSVSPMATAKASTWNQHGKECTRYKHDQKSKGELTHKGPHSRMFYNFMYTLLCNSESILKFSEVATNSVDFIMALGDYLNVLQITR